MDNLYKISRGIAVAVVCFSTIPHVYANTQCNTEEESGQIEGMPTTSFLYSTNTGLNFDISPVGTFHFAEMDFTVFEDSQSKIAMPLKWDTEGKTSICMPSNIAIREVVWSPEDYPMNNWDNGWYTLKEYPLFNFNFGQGVIYNGIIGIKSYPKSTLELHLVPNFKVISTRTVMLGGVEKRVQKITQSGLEVSSNPLYPPHHSLPVIVVEGIGSISGHSIAGIPIVSYFDAGFETFPDDGLPVLEAFQFESGGKTYHYTPKEIGLSLYDQLLCSDFIWEYYSEDDECSAVHRLAVVGEESVGGKVYKVIRTVSSDILSKSTHEFTHYGQDSLDSNVKWLMREDFGRVFTLMPDGEEEQFYDFALQAGENVIFNDCTFSVSDIDTDYRYKHFNGYVEPMKTYRLLNDEGKDILMTEFLGCRGLEGGYLPFPNIAGERYSDNMGITPEVPAFNSTLSRLMTAYGEEKYITAEFANLVMPFYKYAGIAAGNNSIDEGNPVFFTTMGCKASFDSYKGILIRTCNGKHSKIIKK